MSSIRTETGAVMRLALPLIGANIGTMLMGVVDTVMVGNVGKEALAASVLANVWLSGTLLFGMGIVYGLDPIVSQAHGARDSARLGRALQRGIVIALAISLPLAILWFMTEPFLMLSGPDVGLAQAAARYVRVQIPTLPLFMVFTAIRQYLQGRGILRVGLIVIAFANVGNVIFNYALIFGHLGMPELGLFGAGIATAMTRGIMFIGILIMLRRGRLLEGGWVPWSRAAVSWRGLREIMRHGIPSGVHMALEIWAFGTATLMARYLGVTALAAHGIVMNMASLSFMVPLGVSQAAVTRVGNLIGERRHGDAQNATYGAFFLGGGLMALFGVGFLVGANYLPRLYTDDIAVVTLCAATLPIAAAFQVFDGLQVVGSGALRAMGRAGPAAWFNLIGFWVLALPLAWWMTFRLDMGLAGIWWGLAIGLAIVAALMIGFIVRRGPATALYQAAES